MIEWLFNLPDASQVTYFEWYPRSAWPTWVALLLMLGGLVLSIGLYRKTAGLGAPARWTLTALRTLILAIVILLIWQPAFAIEMQVKLRRMLVVMVDTSQSMAIEDRQSAAAEPDAAPRIQRVKQTLAVDRDDLLEQLADDYELRLYAFDQTTRPIARQADELLPAVAQLRPEGEATRLGAALDTVMQETAGQPMAGVVMITDGASNQGIDPIEVAGRLADRQVPLYPVGVGLPDPPDVGLQRIIVQRIVFPEDNVPIRVQLRSTGFANRTAEMTVSLDGREMNRKLITLTGDAQFEEITFKPTKADAGAREVQVRIEPQPGEAVTENNAMSHDVRIIDEKIKVLYVEGKPRWEYRYLRGVLLRDHRLDVKFLMTEGDEDLARFSDRHLARFPVEADEAFEFDMVIIGDVPAYFFTPEQLERIEQLVRQRSGSLLFLAGRRHSPGSYRDTVLEDALPVRLPALVNGRGGSPTVPVNDAAYPRVTPAGDLAASVTLHANRQTNEAIWSLVRPMYELPDLAGPKAAAYVLLTLRNVRPDLEDYPLVAWQRFGSGKAMYVGTDALWRMRFKRGDTWHARFWSQTIQFLTLSRLLSGSNRISIETDRVSYRTGQRVAIYANVLNDVWLPIQAESYTVRVTPADPQQEPSEVELTPVPDHPGLYQGYFAPQAAGRYRIEAPQQDVAFANETQISVTTVALEQREPALQVATLQKLADQTGGKYLPLSQLGELPALLPADQLTTTRRLERDLWDLPLIFVLLVLLAGTEWMLRRRWNMV